MSLPFTRELSSETKNNHSKVDHHEFSRSISLNPLAGQMYVNFNKICINEIQKVLVTKGYKHQVFEQLHRNIDIDSSKLVRLYACDSLNVLVNRCKDYPLEHAYMFYLGLLFGGSMLQKMLPHEDQTFFQYDNRQKLIQEFKTFLNEYITDIQRQKQFIECVNHSYVLIYDIFSDLQKLAMGSM